MQITTCGTYPFRFGFLPARFAFFDKSGVALDIIGMFLAVALPVFGAGAINLLLLVGTCHESNLDSATATAHPTAVSARGDSPGGHRYFAVL